MNVEEMKKQLQALKSGRKTNSNSDGIKYFRPDPAVGKYKIRVIEGKQGPLIKEWHWHYRIGENNKTFLCNKRNSGEGCPVCELGSELWREYVATEEAGKPEQAIKEAAMQFFSRNRFYTNVLVRGRENEGPMVYSFGKTVATAMYECFVDPDYNGEFLDVENGYDFSLTYTRSNPQDPRTSETSLRPAPKATPVADSKEGLAAILEGAYNLDELYDDSDIEEIEKELATYDTEPDDNSVGHVHETASNSVVDAINNLEASD